MATIKEDPKASKEEVLVTVRALVVLRDTKGQPVPIGETTEVPESASKILVSKKKAELVNK